MEIHLMQFSVVIAGETHNPTILNPDFLTIREIVPKEWGWEVAGQTITTPPFAVVRYTNGMSITVEPNKLQVADLSVGNDPMNSKATEIARRYVSTLPHVRYTAVGINFHSIAEVPDPEASIKTRFLKSGLWDSPSHPLNAVGLRLVYPLSGGRLVLALDAGEAERANGDRREKRPVIIANANFHRECKAYPADREVETHLSQVATDWAQYRSLLHDTLETEGEKR
jgi:hypothetical protein